MCVMVVYMKIKRSGKTIRVHAGALPMINDLREAIDRTTTVGGVTVGNITRSSDGVVISLALMLALDAVKTSEK